ncbi:unnamed protein product [Trichobilharzia regenti]|nr:unnamed protein product [Trichobilharzia regenti]
MGVMYLYGIGVKENRESALYCLSEASARGSLYARANLIYFYYQRKMFTNACYLASRMVSSDDILPSSDCILTFQYRAMSMACFLYALCLKSGKGVEKNESLASELFRQVVIIFVYYYCKEIILFALLISCTCYFDKMYKIQKFLVNFRHFCLTLP